jgi:hypothetical protein
MPDFQQDNKAQLDYAYETGLDCCDWVMDEHVILLLVPLTSTVLANL